MNDPASGRPSPKECWAQVGDLRMRYLDWGGDGPPVMALHGLASSANWYDLVAPYLRARFRVIAPDQRGHGQTTQATSGYHWQSLSQDVVGLMGHLGFSQAGVLGHSWGGYVATHLAGRFPERVNRLVMIDGGFNDWGRIPGATWEAYKARLAPRNVSGTRPQFLARIRGQLDCCWNAEVERIVQTMVYEDQEGQIHDILQPDHHSQVMHAMWHEPPSSIFPRIACPTLIVPAGPVAERAGTEMAQRRREMVGIASQAIQRCRVCWVPETIHDIGYHKPAVLAKVVAEFLTEG
ncbi:MAG: alpha/beta hydrolase [Dehalococcoidia bacterium]|nr:alpha/beta hydrolase [Dehalococcoidia bacterium]MSQ15974.1 alpha/beta hydrolase [Dehalococcoidia bacterium]